MNAHVTDLDPGVVRTTAKGQRALIDELREQNALLTQRAERAEREAFALATFIKQRAGVSVWDHVDVMQTLQDAVVTPLANVLRAVKRAESEGLPMSATTVREIVVSQFERSRVGTIERIGREGERGAANSPDLLTDRMKVDLGNVLKLPNAA